MMFLAIILVIALFYYAVRQPVPGVSPSCGKRDALDVLRERYARGEMDAAEFRARREELSR
ncbi:SHOCT domain protein [Acididesulfobacillus acetoxydans]|uniref:SHOCT domain protein n=1 Tax=Acididesulfobacillus acetoxydans TaxID=1561005 RepID=A0A8S0WP31_9FIRM|nr:SHOCT domain-containing protein [Acididesulfobacillus acetoxydans]CAA7601644.1 SHOCT domain protein [Acididesulfobacillus acetoxydans]CEJ07131.1 Short C-terminal domain [Acididesulfobacillus acetoxydans]